jgi:CelD/BcsL family acetyltransferase involved in cellulose biosynthesis
MNEIQSAVIAAFRQDRSEPASAVARATVESSSRSVPGLHISVSDNLTAVETVWRRFEPDADCTVFQTFDYLSLWQRYIGVRHAVTPAIVTVRYGAGTLAILPLAIARAGLLRRLSWLGQEHCDYLAPLLAKNFSDTVSSDKFVALWREIVDLMQSDTRFRHDLVELRKMPEKVGGQSSPFLALGVTRNPSSAHLTTLTGDWETFYDQKRSSATRRRDRTKRKRLGESGEVRMVTPQGESEVIQTIETLVHQKSAALKRMGVADLFAEPGVRDFYVRLATDPRTRDIVHVSRLDVGTVPASVNLSLQFRNRYHYIFASYDGGELSRFGPGAAHLRDLMAHAISQGCREFDFTIGDERYKFEWSDTETTLVDYFSATTARGWPESQLQRGLAAAKRTIKQNPALWSAFQKVRSAAGSLRRFPKS